LAQGSYRYCRNRFQIPHSLNLVFHMMLLKTILALFAVSSRAALVRTDMKGDIDVVSLGAEDQSLLLVRTESSSMKSNFDEENSNTSELAAPRSGRIVRRQSKQSEGSLAELKSETKASTVKAHDIVRMESDEVAVKKAETNVEEVAVKKAEKKRTGIVRREAEKASQDKATSHIVRREAAKEAAKDEGRVKRTGMVRKEADEVEVTPTSLVRVHVDEEPDVEVEAEVKNPEPKRKGKIVRTEEALVQMNASEVKAKRKGKIVRTEKTEKTDEVPESEVKKPEAKRKGKIVRTEKA